MADATDILANYQKTGSSSVVFPSGTVRAIIHPSGGNGIIRVQATGTQLVIPDGAQIVLDSPDLAGKTLYTIQAVGTMYISCTRDLRS